MISKEKTNEIYNESWTSSSSIIYYLFSTIGCVWCASRWRTVLARRRRKSNTTNNKDFDLIITLLYRSRKSSFWNQALTWRTFACALAGSVYQYHHVSISISISMLMLLVLVLIDFDLMFSLHWTCCYLVSNFLFF